MTARSEILSGRAVFLFVISLRLRRSRLSQTLDDMKFAKAFALFLVTLAVASCGEKKVSLGDYPLDTCVVGGKKLGSMGEPYLHMYEGQKVYFCCEGCKETFSEDPKKFIAKIEAAKAKK
jgi:YHS domain-containing protein